MTRSASGTRRPRIQPLRNWTLRTRLVTSLLGLIILLCLAIGSVTELSLRQFLIRQLDKQLSDAGGRTAGAIDRSRGTPPFGPAQNPLGGCAGFSALTPGGSAVGTIGARIGSDGTSQAVIVAQGSDPAACPQSLSHNALDAVSAVPRDGLAHSVSVPGYGKYRVLSRTVADGDVVITGLPLKAVTSTLTQLILVISLLTILGLIVAALLGTVIVRLALRPLQRVTATASRVAEMPLDEGEVALAVRVPDPNPHTEVGQVGVALNHMLENVSEALSARHRSETRVRQFVADASHELRTPLASIRGYAELTRHSRLDASPDMAHAMDRVESEAQRMSALVEDLLLLARLDAGRPLDRDEVDLTMLAVDVLSDAHAAGPTHLWRLDLGDDPITCIGDKARLQQVLVNILANSRLHTPSGTTVLLSLTAEADNAVLRVIDNGPGIPPGLIEDVFERFARGEESRSRSAGSTGLGLAIASAVVAAHGGTIAVDSRPGRTEFTVRLPLHADRQGFSQTQPSLAGQDF